MLLSVPVGVVLRLVLYPGLALFLKLSLVAIAPSSSDSCCFVQLLDSGVHLGFGRHLEFLCFPVLVAVILLLFNVLNDYYLRLLPCIWLFE